jgi:hypothetical protein
MRDPTRSPAGAARTARTVRAPSRVTGAAARGHDCNGVGSRVHPAITVAQPHPCPDVGHVAAVIVAGMHPT